MSDYLLPQVGSDWETLRTAAQANLLSQAGKKAVNLAGLDGLAGDAGRVNLAAIQVLQGEAGDALEGILQSLPFLSFDRPALAFAHLIGAQTLRDLRRLPEAAHWCSLAYEAASSPAAKSWRVAILCLWAGIHQSLGQPEQALSRLSMAARMARDRADQFHVQRSLGAYWTGLDAQKSQYHRQLAGSLAITERHRWLLKQEESFPSASTSISGATPVFVNLLGGISITVNGVVASAASSPRAALLLAFLIMNDGELLDEIAAQILPPDIAIKLPDKALADRVARVRQHVSQARRVLGDPAAIICKERRLWLNRRYFWAVDLQQSIFVGRFDANRISPLLDCLWLQEIRYTTTSNRRR